MRSIVAVTIEGDKDRTRLPAEIARSAILGWYHQHKRDLPWRRDPRPWPVWVSEIMLQQTRVDSVIEYFNRFMARFPTPGDLAAAEMDEVLGLWAGLGYYARARNLHFAAQQVVTFHDGEVPSDPVAFAQLKGVGRYTCGAVQSIAFQHPMPIVDGNVIRVLTRLDGIVENPQKKTINEALWHRAEELAQGARPGDLNQGIMELGALVCHAKSPHCLLCPLSDDCVARAKGIVDQVPVKVKKKPRPKRYMLAFFAQDHLGRVYLGRRPDSGLLGGLWALPSVEVLGEHQAIFDQFGLKNQGQPVVIEHGFTHQIWVVHAYRVAGFPIIDGFESFERFTPEKLRSLGVAGPSLKALRALGVELPHRRGAGRRR